MNSAEERPLLLDLFCGAGGAGMGYHRAGFQVIGVDLELHPDYPFQLIVGDAMEYLSDLDFLAQFDVIHASPPCPRYSVATPAEARENHPDLVGPVREALRAWGGTYVIENVEGAPLINPLLLCGSEFSLGADCRDGRRRYLKRHRLFESNAWLMGAGGCHHRGQAVGVYGDGGGGPSTRPSGGGGYKAYPEEARQAMDIEWMKRDDLSDAIPPVYTQFIGEQLMENIAAAPDSETEAAA